MLYGIKVIVLKAIKKMTEIEYLKVAELENVTVKAIGYVGSVSGKGTIKLGGKVVPVKKIHGQWFAMTEDIR